MNYYNEDKVDKLKLMKKNEIASICLLYASYRYIR